MCPQRPAVLTPLCKRCPQVSRWCDMERSRASLSVNYSAINPMSGPPSTTADNWSLKCCTLHCHSMNSCLGNLKRSHCFMAKSGTRWVHLLKKKAVTPTGGPCSVGQDIKNTPANSFISSSLFFFLFFKAVSEEAVFTLGARVRA